MDQPSSSRRLFLKSVGATTIGTAATNAAAANATRPHHPHSDAHSDTHSNAHAASAGERPAYVFLNPQEARFIEAAVARLIPSDDAGPGALDADVSGYIDKQLGGAWGAGERLYRSGPWHEGTPSQGYQMPFTPAELFRTALREAHADVQKRHGKPFEQLQPIEQDTYLTTLQNGEADLGSVPSKVFFESLWAMTIEGFFSDPAYGGNKDMVSWKMIGFPGAYANYYHLVDQHGIAFDQPPMSLSQNGRGHIHIHPDMSAMPGGKG